MCNCLCTIFILVSQCDVRKIDRNVSVSSNTWKNIFYWRSFVDLPHNIEARLLSTPKLFPQWWLNLTVLFTNIANVTVEVKVTSSVQNSENVQIWIKIKSDIKFFSPTYQYQAYSHETHAHIVTYFQLMTLVSHTTKTRSII